MFADIWREYNAIIASYTTNDYISEILESIWTDSNGTDINFSLIDSLIPGETTLLDVLERLTITLPDTPKNQREIYNINLRQFMGLLCINLHIPDVENSEESSVLRSLNTFFNFMNAYAENLLELDENCMSTYKLGIQKLQERQMKLYGISSTFLLNYNKFIEIQNMDFTLAIGTLQFLIEYGSSYQNMIQNLSIYSDTCNPGFLSFVCLSTLILRKHMDKKKFLVYLFNLISAKLSSYEGNEMQTGIINSNFQLLIRQVGQQMLFESDEIVLALLRVGPYYSNIKPIALLINQLPFSQYTTLVKILRKLTMETYKLERQEFAYSLLESPYITCDGHQEDHFYLTKLLIKTVIFPLRSGNPDNVKKTVVFLSKILKLQDQTTQEALKDIIKEEKQFTISNILNYIFEKTNPLWDKSYIQTNESFILIYSNLFILNYEIPWNNFLQLEEIINSSDVITLIPSIPILIQTLKKAMYMDDELTYLIGTTLVTNALSPNMQYSRYLQALYRFMFEDGNNGKVGIEVCSVLSTYGVNVKNLISKMYIQQYFKLPTLCKLFNHIKDRKGLKLIDKAIYVVDTPIVLPGIQLHKFCMDFITNPKACIDENFNTLCSILMKVAETSYEPRTHEWELLHAFLNFIEINLINRMFPIGLLKAAVITMKKLKDTFHSNYRNLLGVYKDIGANIIATNYENYNSLDLQFITRDIYYFTEFAVVFGEKPGFVVPKEVVEVIGNYLNMPINDLLKKEEISEVFIKSASILVARREELLVQISKLLNKLVYVDNEIIQITALHGLHDLAVLKSQHFDSLVTPICHFMKSSSHKLQIDGLQLFMKLVDKEYIIPNYWQLYCITYIIASEFNVLVVEMGKLVIYNFINMLAKCYEQYFINIVLYFNNYYDHQIYPLKTKDLSKIPTKQVALDRREAVYKLILRSFSSYTYHKILNHIYNALFRNMFLTSMTYAKSYELVQDVMTITLIVLKRSHFTYAKGNLKLYCHTIERIKNLEISQLNRSKIPETDNDHTIKNVVCCLIDLMKVADGRIKFIMPELMHLLLAVCEWYFDNICNIILNEKNKGFYNTVKSFPALYKSFRHLLHSPTFDTPSMGSANTSQFYRI